MEELVPRAMELERVFYGILLRFYRELSFFIMRS